MGEIDAVEKRIRQNPQADTFEKQTKLVIDFAKRKIETKAAVEAFLTKNKENYSKKNYEIFEKLVRAVTPPSAQEQYKKPLEAYKKAVDEKVAKEKSATKAKKQEQATVYVDRTVEPAQIDTEPVRAASPAAKPATNNQKPSQVKTVQTEQAQPKKVEAKPEVKQAPVVQAAPPVVQEAPAPRTDGFNFKGYHFDLSSFAGLGFVPKWTPYIYRWSDDPSHYLIEKASDAGSAIWSVSVIKLLSMAKHIRSLT